MSLFGDSPTEASSRTKQSALFADEDLNRGGSPKARNTSTSLFADDADQPGDSPWSLPTPKKAAQSTLIKTLLRPGDVPETYVDIYDKLLLVGNDTGGGGGGSGRAVSLASAKRLLVESGLDERSREKFESTVMPVGTKELTRGEVNVLLALIGLAQEGEEDVTLDGVDERRKNLPVPLLGSFYTTASKSAPNPPVESQASGHADDTTAVTATAATAAAAVIAAAAPPSPSPSPSVARPDISKSAITGYSQIRPTRKESFGYTEADPWGSPELHKGHNHPPTNGVAASNNLPTATAASLPQRTTSAFTTSSQATNASASEPASTRQSGVSDAGWDVYGPGPADSFRDSGLGSGGVGSFRDSAGPGGGDNNPPPGLGSAFAAPRLTNTGPEDVITITSMAEKEGVFLFQHRNYQVTSARRNSKVIRRYSDFVWLLDCLHKRYPFRQLPLLPPKRVASECQLMLSEKSLPPVDFETAVNGNHLAADATFLEKRRRGLARFANSLVRHPVLNQEQLIIMFFTVPTELAVWRKQATISVQEEFAGKNLPATLEDSLPADLLDLFARVRTGVKRSAEIYINMCTYLERLAKRNEGVAIEYMRISTALQSLTSSTADTYATDTGDMVLLNSGLMAASKHAVNEQGLLEDEARAWDEGVLEDLKKVRDGLVSMRDMFDRKDYFDKDNIPQLERRIQKNEERLLDIRAKPEGTVKPGDAEKVEEAIFKDKQSIVAQHARGVFIKECIRDEIMFFRGSQFQISRLHQDWAAERVKYAELQAENWRTLAEEVEVMPTGET